MRRRLPLVSPFIQSFWRVRLQNVTKPVSCVLRQLSSFRKPSISTWPVRASCTMPGARPSIFAKSIVGSVISVLCSSNSLGFVLEKPKARQRLAPAGFSRSWCCFTSGYLESSSAPARSSRDDGGDDDDGRESASLKPQYF